MHFEHVGLLCRHIFYVFKFYSIEQIPKEYIMRRRFSNSLLDLNSDMTTIEIFSNVDRCVSFLRHDAAKLKSYLEELNKLKKKIIIGVELTNDVPDIKNPLYICNNGTDSCGKRFKSKKEMLEKVSLKPKRSVLYVNRWLTMINEIVLSKNVSK
uniref:Protein FAR1-RELATED SEQUENCE n=1 Tax=Lactuca sativa TaxID=4236 RepID=A0A9R1VNH1_LACSA|nr:hypothetical protein LSAT_V11C500245320 [Lactuca sativa]